MRFSVVLVLSFFLSLVDECLIFMVSDEGSGLVFVQWSVLEVEWKGGG